MHNNDQRVFTSSNLDGFDSNSFTTLQNTVDKTAVYTKTDNTLTGGVLPFGDVTNIVSGGWLGEKYKSWHFSGAATISTSSLENSIAITTTSGSFCGVKDRANSDFALNQPKIKPNTKYRVSFKIKLENMTGDSSDGVRLVVITSNTTGISSVYPTGFLKVNTNGFIQNSLTFTTLGDAIFGHLNIQIIGDTGAATLAGKATFKDIKLEEVIEVSSANLISPADNELNVLSRTSLRSCEAQTTSSATPVSIGATGTLEKVAQSFLASHTKFIKATFVKASNVGTPTADIQVSLSQDDGSDNPENAVEKHRWTFTNAEWNAVADGGVLEALMPCITIVGQKYWLILSTTNDASNYRRIGGNTTTGYADGTYKSSISTSWTDQTRDIYFLNYYSFSPEDIKISQHNTEITMSGITLNNVAYDFQNQKAEWRFKPSTTNLESFGDIFASNYPNLTNISPRLLTDTGYALTGTNPYQTFKINIGFLIRNFTVFSNVFISDGSSFKLSYSLDNINFIDLVNFANSSGVGAFFPFDNTLTGVNLSEFFLKVTFTPGTIDFYSFGSLFRIDFDIDTSGVQTLLNYPTGVESEGNDTIILPEASTKYKYQETKYNYPCFEFFNASDVLLVVFPLEFDTKGAYVNVSVNGGTAQVVANDTFYTFTSSSSIIMNYKATLVSNRMLATITGLGNMAMINYTQKSQGLVQTVEELTREVSKISSKEKTEKTIPVSASTTLVHTELADTTFVMLSNASTLTLPDPKLIGGKEILVKALDATATKKVTSSFLIDGTADYTFSASNQAVRIKSMVSTYMIISKVS